MPDHIIQVYRMVDGCNGGQVPDLVTELANMDEWNAYVKEANCNQIKIGAYMVAYRTLYVFPVIMFYGLEVS